MSCGKPQIDYMRGALMKKFLSVVLSLCLVVCAAACVAEGTDAVSSASVADFYGDFAITGDELMDAINSFSGCYLVTSCDAEGNFNTGFYIYGCKKIGDEYYLQFGLADNQTKQNLLATGKALAVYAKNPEEGGKPYPVSGARMWAEMVTDPDLLSQLDPDNAGTALYFHITSVRSLG